MCCLSRSRESVYRQCSTSRIIHFLCYILSLTDMLLYSIARVFSVFYVAGRGCEGGEKLSRLISFPLCCRCSGAARKGITLYLESRTCPFSQKRGSHHQHFSERRRGDCDRRGSSRSYHTKRYVAGSGREVKSFNLGSDNLENRGIRCYYNML